MQGLLKASEQSAGITAGSNREYRWGNTEPIQPKENKDFCSIATLMITVMTGVATLGNFDGEECQKCLDQKKWPDISTGREKLGDNPYLNHVSADRTEMQNSNNLEMPDWIYSIVILFLNTKTIKSVKMKDFRFFSLQLLKTYLGDTTRWSWLF